jgi:hypothetical protein
MQKVQHNTVPRASRHLMPSLDTDSKTFTFRQWWALYFYKITPLLYLHYWYSKSNSQLLILYPFFSVICSSFTVPVTANLNVTKSSLVKTKGNVLEALLFAMVLDSRIKLMCVMVYF